jgi:hypothetical protein
MMAKKEMGKESSKEAREGSSAICHCQFTLEGDGCQQELVKIVNLRSDRKKSDSENSFETMTILLSMSFR